MNEDKLYEDACKLAMYKNYGDAKDYKEIVNEIYQDLISQDRKETHMEWARFPFAFTIESGYWDKDKAKWIASIESGMGICYNFTDAAAQIETFYGDELVAIKSLILLEEGDLIFMEPEWIEAIEKDQFWEIGRHKKETE